MDKDESRYSPTLLLWSAMRRLGTELPYLAGRLSMSNGLLNGGHDEFVIRDIRLLVREINAELAAFDAAEPEMARMSLLEVERHDKILAQARAADLEATSQTGE